MKKTTASAYPGLALPKNTMARRAAKIQKRADRIAHIARIRERVFDRDKHRCRCCHKGYSEVWSLEMNEICSRAQMRGRPHTEVFTLENCLVLCGPPTDTTTCHGKVTAHRVKILTASSRGANGNVTFIEEKGS